MYEKSITHKYIHIFYIIHIYTHIYSDVCVCVFGKNPYLASFIVWTPTRLLLSMLPLINPGFNSADNKTCKLIDEMGQAKIKTLTLIPPIWTQLVGHGASQLNFERTTWPRTDEQTFNVEEQVHSTFPVWSVWTASIQSSGVTTPKNTSVYQGSIFTSYLHKHAYTCSVSAFKIKNVR